MHKTICFILPHFHLEFSGGAETQCFFLAQELLRRGWAVHYIREAKPRAPTEAQGIHLHAMPQRRKLFKWRNHGALGRLMSSVKADFWYVRANTSYLPHVVWHARRAGGRVIWAFSRDSQLARGGRSVSGRWLHNLGVDLDERLFFRSLRHVDQILFQTQRQKQSLAQLAALSGEVIYNAHPLGDEAAVPREDLVIWIGRLQRFKHPERFLALAEQLASEPLRFYLIGDSRDSALREQVRDAALRLPNAEWLGAVPPNRVHEVLARARLLVNTSDYEGFSNTFVEAWMRGVPVVSLHVDPDGLIAGRQLGLVESDLQTAATRIRRLVFDREEWQHCSARCERFAHENLRIEGAVDKLEACLARLGAAPPR